jgi:hypothetical protein
MGDLFYPLVCLPRPYNSSFELSKPCQLTPTHCHFIHPCQNPKSDFSLMCDSCNSSKRGSFAFPSINRTPPSLISHHLLSYCYATGFLPHLSLSCSSCFHFTLLLRVLEQLVAARLSFWINRKAMEDLKKQRVFLLLLATIEVILF